MIRSVIPLAIVTLVNLLYSNGQSTTECSNNEELAVLEIQFDQNADETGYTLVCDDVTKWDVPIGTLSNQFVGVWQLEQACIPMDVAICNFTISDFGRDGLTGGYNGFFTLSFGATTVALAEYGKVAPFSRISYCFGRDCNSPLVEENEDDDNKYGWKTVDFNTTLPPRPNNTTQERNETGADGNDTDEWVVQVTRPKKNETDIDVDETGPSVENVTHTKDDGTDVDFNETVTKDVDFNETVTKNVPSTEKDVEPNDNYSAPKYSTAPEMTDQTTNRSENRSPSASSLAVIACVVSSILIGLVGMAILYKRRKRGAGGVAANRSRAATTPRPVLPIHLYPENTFRADSGDDDEKSKNSSGNVHQAETFVTYDSDNTVVQKA